jgi:hypothetical protein
MAANKRDPFRCGRCGEQHAAHIDKPLKCKGCECEVCRKVLEPGAGAGEALLPPGGGGEA